MTTSTVERPSVCPLDCPDTCSLTVTVDAGRITKIRGSRANPYTAGVLCAKVPESYPEFVHGPGRLTTPLVRDGGGLRPATWDEALDRAAEGLRRAKATDTTKSFGIFSCSKATNEMNFLAQKLARQVMGTNNIDSCNRT